MRCKIDTRGNPFYVFHELHPARPNINPITRTQLQDEPGKAVDDEILQDLQDWEPLQGGLDATFREMSALCLFKICLCPRVRVQMPQPLLLQRAAPKGP